MLKFKYEHGRKAAGVLTGLRLPTRFQGPVLSYRATGFSKNPNYFKKHFLVLSW